MAAASAARARAYAPYSRFQVGAALLCADGAVVVGVNVENASYGLCQCAERTAVGTAVAEGRSGIIAVAVVTGSSPPSPPCGMCRQVLAELCAPELVVVMANPAGERSVTTLGALFPGSFDAALLLSGQTIAPSADLGPSPASKTGPAR